MSPDDDSSRNSDEPGRPHGGIEFKRRQLLLGGSTLFAGGLAGCFQSASDTVTPTGSDGASPTPTDTPTETDGDGSTPTTTDTSGWPDPDDPYFSRLVTDLSFEDLPPGEFLYGMSESTVMDAYEVFGDAASTTRISVDSIGIPISQATRVEVTGDVTNPWDVTLRGTVEDRGVSQGDVLLGVVYLRSPSSSEGTDPTAQYVAKDEDNQSSNMVRNATSPTLGPGWTRYDFPIRFDYDAEPGTWWTEIFLGYGQQTVDIGGLALVDFGQDVSVDQLPAWEPEYAYAGRAEDAQWRQAAADRIEEIRKADLDVKVVDGDGTAIEGASVDISMQEHAFGFGGEFALSQVGDRWESEVAETYRQKFLENFNKAALTNALKVPPWNGEWGSAVNAENARRAIDWFTENDVPKRGHTLVWEEWEWMNIDQSSSDDRINELVKQRIRNRASEFRGVLAEWDMHNHPIWRSNIRDQIGREHVLEWWETAHDAAPDAQMYVNAFRIIAGDSYRDQYDDYIAWLMENDAGVEGIGFMGHFDINGLTPPEELLSVFDQFAEHGVPLQITEFDVQNVDREDPAQVSAQADYVRDVLTAAFSHEALEGVMSWCFWDENGQAKRYYDVDWTLRPHGEEYQRLVFEEWWTDESGQTGSEGTYSTRGFKGDYELTATDGEQSKTLTTTLTDDGTTVEITLSDS